MHSQDEDIQKGPAQKPAEMEVSLDLRLLAALEAYASGETGRPAVEVFADLRSRAAQRQLAAQGKE